MMLIFNLGNQNVSEKDSIIKKAQILLKRFRPFFLFLDNLQLVNKFDLPILRLDIA